jgi:hypothetical protein
MYTFTLLLRVLLYRFSLFFPVILLLFIHIRQLLRVYMCRYF